MQTISTVLDEIGCRIVASIFRGFFPAAEGNLNPAAVTFLLTRLRFYAIPG
jgi:hypothetical protein